MHLPDLIFDLALILIVGGVTTVIFKKIRQPLVLGYIVAGFLTGPFFTYLPTVTDMHDIEIWSEIGIICLMFVLGLESSFHKLANVGGTAIITSITEVAGMFLFGFVAARLLGWGMMDCVILGGVLSMSSTTIIIKAFDELNMKGQPFTGVVFGTLIVEDIVGIFLMVVMSTFALGQGSGGAELALTIVQLLFYLVLWLVLGIFIIPTLLRLARDLMNDETLLIVSLGVCFGMVLLFHAVGFSTALGAFIAGSILAGTLFGEKIEHLLKPIKDLFGAVFFISVGMLVDPAILIRYALPILVITVATIIGKLLFSTMGALLSGQRLQTAVSVGASLAQIGEFAFIIAALGSTLKLSSDFIYPVVVSVSVVTTFTTPFFIKHADTIYRGVKRVMPAKLYEKLDSYTSDNRGGKENNTLWRDFMKRYFLDTLMKSIISIGILEASVYFGYPFIMRFLHGTGGQAVTTVVTLLCMSPFLGTLLYQRDKNFSMLLMKSKTNRLPLLAFVVLRVVIAAVIMMATVNAFMSISMIWLLIPTLLIIVLISRSDWIIGRYLQIEAHFLANFNEKHLLESEQVNGDEPPTHAPRHSWISEQLWVADYHVGADFAGVGNTLSDLKWGRNYKVTVIKVLSDRKHSNIPDSGQKLRARDTVLILGTRDQIDFFESAAPTRMPGLSRQKDPVTLRDFIVSADNGHDENQLFCYAITVKRGQRFEGKNLKGSELRSDLHCNIIGIQRDKYPIIQPDVQFVINSGDQIWLLGGYKMVSRLIMENMIQTDEYAEETVLRR